MGTDRAQGMQTPREEGVMPGSKGRQDEPSHPAQAMHLPLHPKSPYQLPHTTVSLLGTVYYHWSWRCHGKSPALGRENEREEEKGAQQHTADPSQGGGGSLLAQPGLCHCHTSHPGWDLSDHSSVSQSRCWVLSVGWAQLTPHAAGPLTHPLLLFQPGPTARGTSAGTGGGCPAGWTLPWPAASTWPPRSPGGGSLAVSARGTTTTAH